MLTDQDLLVMRDEVREWTLRKGWRGVHAPRRTMGEDLALLHTELAEATEAFRVHGMERWYLYDDGWSAIGATKQILSDDSWEYKTKPEGVASELIDTLIRLLDNYAEHGLEPMAYVIHDDYDADSDFGQTISALHALVGDIHIKWYWNGWKNMHNNKRILNDLFDKVLSVLLWATWNMGFDVKEEFRAKMNYNETREMRHGGKRL